MNHPIVSYAMAHTRSFLASLDVLLEHNEHQYCIACIRPHIFRLCDGGYDFEHFSCTHHGGYDSLSKYIAKQTDRSRGSDLPKLDIEQYDLIKRELGLVHLAEQYHKAMLMLPRNAGASLFRALMDNMAPEAVRQKYRQRQAARVKDLIDGKRHREGCLRSGKPDVIIELGLSKQLEDDLTTAVYFRRCNGVYRNIRGERHPSRGIIEKAVALRAKKSKGVHV